jgi:hypothetical protein
MLDDEFNKRQAILLRDLATRADPFIRRRLLDLANRYERPKPRPIPLPSVGVFDHSDSRGQDDG